jgi:putative transposase
MVRPRPVRALAESERQRIADTLCEDRFVDRSPAEVYYTLLDEGQHLGSERTFYRVLAQRNSVQERRNQLRHPPHQRPELVATGTNEVWSWDTSKLRTTTKWQYFYLYVLLDLYSRYAVGWMIARHDNAALAKTLIRESVQKHDVAPGTLVLHSDRGPAMTSKTLAQLLVDLDVTRSLSRPHTSNDNPFSESAFRTAKYHSSYPPAFTCHDHALAWGREFFHWYNNEHRHSGVAYLRPADVYFGRADAVLAQRHTNQMAAFRAHPERYPNGAPKRQVLAPATYINPPHSKAPACVVDSSVIDIHDQHSAQPVVDSVATQPGVRH